MRTSSRAAPRVGRDISAAAAVARDGGLVVYPTDTLYGLGARIDAPDAVRRVFEAKDRPFEQPLSMAVAEVAAIDAYGVVTDLARRLFHLLPGPLTIVLERRPTVPPLVTGGDSSVGIRVPDHPQALALLRATGPLTATSANRHGGPEPRTVGEAEAALGDRVGYYLESPTPLLAAASTLVDARGREPRILRPGVLGEAEIRRVLGL